MTLIRECANISQFSYNGNIVTEWARAVNVIQRMVRAGGDVQRRAWMW